MLIKNSIVLITILQGKESYISCSRSYSLWAVAYDMFSLSLYTNGHFAIMHYL